MMKAMTNSRKLLLPAAMARAGWDVLAAREDVEAVPFEEGKISKATFHALLADAEGVALINSPFGEAEIRAASRLKVVARHGVGYDTVDVAALTRHGILLMVTGQANSPSVAELALYFMLELAKRGAALNAMVREHRWTDRSSEELPVDLFEKRLLLVGFGRSGARLAKACLALGMTVCVYDPYVDQAAITAVGCAPERDLDAALPRADFVSIHCPRTSETLRMFDAARLARMKPSAYLVNTARGGIIDEPALHAALTTRVIRGAGLDVLDREPPAPDNPLLDLPNVIAAPHMAGVTRESRDRMAIAVANNLLGVLDGAPNVESTVNREALVRHARRTGDADEPPR
jgi:D-3-phosphoglycerate dehydrogenase